jgi:hypothetical protein
VGWWYNNRNEICYWNWYEDFKGFEKSGLNLLCYEIWCKEEEVNRWNYGVFVDG